jgi:hypothetical protein
MAQEAVSGRRRVSTTVIFGWILSLVGTGLWLHGYFVGSGPSVIDWHAHSPWWIADFLPNVESEVGMTFCFVSMIPMYWPRR